MSENQYRSHLWIPDEEVDQLDKKLMDLRKPPQVEHGTHGSTLSAGLQSVVTAYSHLQGDSLSDEDIMIFKLVLPEGFDVYGKRDVAEKEGLKINAVKDKRQAVVSASKSTFQRLQDRVGKYRDSGSLKHFQFVDHFEPYTREEKEANSLRQYLESEKDNLSVDVQMMLMPNLPDDVQKRAVERLSERITSQNQKNTAKNYYLSDGTPVIRAQLPVKELQEIEKDSALYRIEQTGFFRIGQSGLTNLDSTDLGLDPSIDTDSLPVVVVLDSGVDFPDDFASLVPVHWKASDVSGKGTSHGTLVASKVVFSHIGLQLGDPFLKARAKVIDCDIYGAEDTVSQDDMSRRIEEAVVAFHDVAKIFNLSSNVDKAIEGDELSILGYQLDCLMRNYRVKFVISAGNHHLAESCNTLEEMLDDTDARIAEPADSMLGITVGAVAGAELGNVFSKRGEPTAYTRIGPGFAGFYKPDLVAYAGNLTRSLKAANDPFSYMMIPGGKLGLDVGTSFSAPVVAGDLAEVAASIPQCDILLAQSLLYNGAEKIWDTSKIDKQEAIYIGNQFGRGLSVPENCKFSLPHRVTFLRSGSLRKAHKEHVKFLMPEIQAATKGNNTTKVIVTCITDSPFDKTKGEQYLGASITASLHKLTQNGKLVNGNPNNSDNKEKWDMCNHFENTFSSFGAGMWEIWLDLFTKWDIDESIEIPYHLAITIEDLTRTNDIYSAVIQESAGRYKPIETVRIPVR